MVVTAECTRTSSNGTKIPHFGIGCSNEAGCSSLRKLSVFLLDIFKTMEKGLANIAVITNVDIVHLRNDMYGLSLCKYF